MDSRFFHLKIWGQPGISCQGWLSLRLTAKKFVFRTTVPQAHCRHLPVTPPLWHITSRLANHFSSTWQMCLSFKEKHLAFWYITLNSCWDVWFALDQQGIWSMSHGPLAHWFHCPATIPKSSCSGHMSNHTLHCQAFPFFSLVLWLAMVYMAILWPTWPES